MGAICVEALGKWKKIYWWVINENGMMFLLFKLPDDLLEAKQYNERNLFSHMFIFSHNIRM